MEGEESTQGHYLDKNGRQLTGGALANRQLSDKIKGERESHPGQYFDKKSGRWTPIGFRREGNKLIPKNDEIRKKYLGRLERVNQPGRKRTEEEKNAQALERAKNSARKRIDQRDALSREENEIYIPRGQSASLTWTPTRERIKKGIMDLMLESDGRRQELQIPFGQKYSDFMRKALKNWAGDVPVAHNVNLTEDFISNTGDKVLEAPPRPTKRVALVEKKANGLPNWDAPVNSLKQNGPSRGLIKNEDRNEYFDPTAAGAQLDAFRDVSFDPTVAGAALRRAFQTGDFSQTPLPVWAGVGKGQPRNGEYRVKYGTPSDAWQFDFNHEMYTDPEGWKRKSQEQAEAAAMQGKSSKQFQTEADLEAEKDAKRAEIEAKAEAAGMTVADYIDSLSEKSDIQAAFADMNKENKERSQNLMLKTKQAIGEAIANNAPAAKVERLQNRLDILQRAIEENKWVDEDENGNIIIKSNKGEGRMDALKAMQGTGETEVNGVDIEKLLSHIKSSKRDHSFWRRVMQNDELRNQFYEDLQKKRAETSDALIQRSVDENPLTGEQRAAALASQARLAPDAGGTYKSPEDLENERYVATDFSNKYRGAIRLLAKEFNLPLEVIKQIFGKQQFRDVADVGPDGRYHYNFGDIKARYGDMFERATTQGNISSALKGLVM